MHRFSECTGCNRLSTLHWREKSQEVQGSAKVKWWSRGEITCFCMWMCCELLFHFISLLLLFDKIPHDWSMLRPSEHFHKSHLTKCGHYPSKARDTGKIASLRFDWIALDNLCTMLLSIFYGSLEQFDHQSLAPERFCHKKAND